MAKSKIFIRQPSVEELEKFPEAVRELVKKGREQGYVTQQELVKAFPEAENDLMLLDDAFALFMNIGVEIVDMKDALIWEKKKEEETGGKKSSKKDPLMKMLEKADMDEAAMDEELDEIEREEIDEIEDDAKTGLDLSEIANDSVRM
jgi:hypothetical protein